MSDGYDFEFEQSPRGSNIVIFDSWTEAADTISFDSTTTPIVVICGPKNTGKSTFSRHLLNSLFHRYKRIAYLDTDVGQPEFTTPGCLSLHLIRERISDLRTVLLKTPERCFFFGDTSPKSDPETYLDYVYCLYDDFCAKYHQSKDGKNAQKVQPPLIVNTPGWVKGVGYDVLVEMLRYIAPTHVVQMRISNESKNLPSGGFWLDEGQKMHASLIEIYAAFRCSSKRSVRLKDARLLRETRIMAYFRQCFPCDSDTTTTKQLAQFLASHPPYEVSISKVKILHAHCQVAKSEVFYSLNATIVGLAVSSEKTVSRRPYCVGLGLVRAVDTLRGLLYVITPVSQCKLDSVDILIQGFIEIPPRLLQIQGLTSPYISTNVLPMG